MTGREELLRLFGIGPEDLDANRRGVLAPAQARRLVRSGVNNLLAALLVGLVLAAILAFVATRPLRAVQVVVAGILFAAVLAVGVLDLRRTLAAAREGRVERLAGPVLVASRGRQGWHLEVAGRSFRLPVRPWHLASGGAYRVYVAARANRVVAMEPVD